MSRTKLVGFLLIVGGLVVIVYIFYRNNPKSQIPLIFSDKSMLEVLWRNYKDEYVDKSGRAVDKQQNQITTSEGQSYTLMRAVWMDDKATYDLALKWTVDNLKRKEDNLFSWLYGTRADGKLGILTERGGYNTATDADTDIALSLIFAYSRWGDPAYIDRAKTIINDVWNKEIVVINDVPYVTANNLEKVTSEKPIINPSYLSPYAYRIFAGVDTLHNWNAVVRSSYDILDKTAASTLDKTKSASLPPDWIILNPATQAVEPTRVTNLPTNFSFDALRVPWRIALDYEWFREPRARAYLNKLNLLSKEWQTKKMISSVYAHDGTAVSVTEAPAMYGGVIGYFKISDSLHASEVYDQKLRYLFNQDTQAFKSDLGYYDSNWVWFGLGLYDDLLPNLSTI